MIGSRGNDKFNDLKLGQFAGGFDDSKTMKTFFCARITNFGNHTCLGCALFVLNLDVMACVTTYQLLAEIYFSIVVSMLTTICRSHNLLFELL